MMNTKHTKWNLQNGYR